MFEKLFILFIVNPTVNKLYPNTKFDTEIIGGSIFITLYKTTGTEVVSFDDITRNTTSMW